MSSNKKLLGKRIKEVRKLSGYTQEKLSEMINIDITTLSGIESGRHFPSLITLEKIAQKLNVSLGNLFDFNHLKPIDEMKKIIKKNIGKLKDEDIAFIYNYISKKYM